MTKKFTYEHWEDDEYVILYNKPIGGTLNKKNAITITDWINGNLEILKQELLSDASENIDYSDIEKYLGRKLQGYEKSIINKLK